MSLIRLHQSFDDTQAYYPFLYPVTATLLTNGNVLNTLREQCDECEGGSNAEVYDPLAGTFIATGKMTALRRGHTATLLADGTVLIAGAMPLSAPKSTIPSPEYLTLPGK